MEKWLEWAIELQSLAQAGLTYGKDIYDKERYERIRAISAEIISNYTDIAIEKVKDLFCNETGYQTPKLDTRAAIFEDGKILLVRENNGKWSLPGGWVDQLQGLWVQKRLAWDIQVYWALSFLKKRLLQL